METLRKIFKKIQDTQLIVVCSILVLISALTMLQGFYEIDKKQEENKVIKELTKMEEK
ncbi:hypothetical protein JTL38_04270 [Pseudomonas aeruginosa]|nr:hypothetical protein [Pseudomonas aeruginosa]MBN0003785.1 hypothetical protein [Pseudomonas aeruginosa]MBN0232476.1 hypothetical protein [Pseudomonas aeruginosa]MBN0390899.1 hypothetical protein [Pseudomonas aeruginosa]MBN0633550.1 hypothetical protein [Pseudomonas aeruginosa]